MNMTILVAQAALADTLAGNPVLTEVSGEAHMNLWDLATKGGWIMIVLAILSIICFYIFFERLSVIRKAGKDDPLFMERIRDAANWGRDLIQSFINGILEKWNALKQTVGNVAQSVKDFLGFSEPKEGPLSNFHTYAPDMMELFAKGIRDNEHLISDAVSSGFDLRDQIGASFNGGRVISSGAPRSISGGNGNTTVILQVDRTELGRVVFQLNDEETQRVGVRLATGGAYA
jgi:hypothetical protein